jgi:hypothetical protein
VQPAVLQLIDLTCIAAREADIPVAVCGEEASDPAAAALLLGLGVHELSVAPSLVDRTRWLVTHLDPDATRRAARADLRAPDPEAVREIAVEIPRDRAATMIRLVAWDVDGTLIGHDGLLPDERRAAVRRLVAAARSRTRSTSTTARVRRPAVHTQGAGSGRYSGSRCGTRSR